MRLIIYGGNLLASILGLAFFLLARDAPRNTWLVPLTVGIYGGVCFWLTSPSNFEWSEELIQWHSRICAGATIATVVISYLALAIPEFIGPALTSIALLIMGFVEYVSLSKAVSDLYKRILSSPKSKEGSWS